MKALFAALHSLAIVQVVVPETDEQVRAETHAFPTEEGQEQAVGKHEHDHAEQEQVDVGKEAGKAAVAVHVTDRVESDERTDARDKQEHHAGKTVEQESDIDLEHRDINPVAERLTDTFFRHTESEQHNTQERKHREKHREGAHETFGRTLLATRRNKGNRCKQDCSQEREKRYKPKR